MYAYQNADGQKSAKQKETSQMKTDAAPSGNQSLSGTAIQRAEQREGHTNDLHTSLSVRLRRPAENRTGLPDRLKSGIEALSGLSMDDVRVHYRSPKPAQLQAYAYTRGTEIHVAPGQEKHLPHEAWHVVQQMQGRVAPTGRINGININDSGALEREADVMGARAAGSNAVPSAALQMKKADRGAAQLVPHVMLGRRDEYGGIILMPNEKPTIVFESMSKYGREAQSVFNETKKYSGNTICVFGLNDKDKMPEIQVHIADEAPHFFRSFDFQWSRPDSGTRENRYMMPFIEARQLVMREAEEIVNRAKAVSGLPEGDPAGKFIYRWIDGDATDDQSEQIPSESLGLLASGDISILSGTYKWRSGAPGTKTHYLELIDKINQVEEHLRAIFFYYYKKLSNKFEPFSVALPAFIGERGTLSDYYLPETSLMMSETAHTTILNGDYGAYVNQEQSKESMKMLHKANIPRNLVAFERSFSIRKPLKSEFAADGENYLGIGLLRLLKAGSQCSFDDFYTELRKMRQSVFLQFTLPNVKLPNQKTYEEIKAHLAQGIYAYYAANYQQISSELSDV